MVPHCCFTASAVTSYSAFAAVATPPLPLPALPRLCLRSLGLRRRTAFFAASATAYAVTSDVVYAVSSAAAEAAV